MSSPGWVPLPVRLLPPGAEPAEGERAPAGRDNSCRDALRSRTQVSPVRVLLENLARHTVHAPEAEAPRVAGVVDLEGVAAVDVISAADGDQGASSLLATWLAQTVAKGLQEGKKGEPGA